MIRKKALFEKLAKAYLSGFVHPYGQVIIIPFRAFKTEWKEQLQVEGCKLVVSNYGRHPCFFVKLPRLNRVKYVTCLDDSEAAEAKHEKEGSP